LINFAEAELYIFLKNREFISAVEKFINLQPMLSLSFAALSLASAIYDAQFVLIGRPVPPVLNN